MVKEPPACYEQKKLAFLDCDFVVKIDMDTLVSKSLNLGHRDEFFFLLMILFGDVPMLSNSKAGAIAEEANLYKCYISRTAKAVHGRGGNRPWNKNNSRGHEKIVHAMLVLSFFEIIRGNLHGDAYAQVLNMAAFYPCTLRAFFCSVKTPIKFPKGSYGDVYANMCGTSHAKDVLRHAAINASEDPIINTGFTGSDKNDGSSGSTEFSSLRALFPEAFEKEDLVWIARRRSALDVSLKRYSSMIDFDQNGRFVLNLPRSGGRYSSG